MPAVLTSVADPAMSVSVTYTRYPSPARVRDVSTRMWDGRTKPEVHRGTANYTRWSWTPVWPGRMRPDAEALLNFFTTLDTMADARFTLEMPAPVGSSAGPWLQTVECVNPQVVQDHASTPAGTEIPLELVEVD